LSLRIPLIPLGERALFKDQTKRRKGPSSKWAGDYSEQMGERNPARPRDRRKVPSFLYGDIGKGRRDDRIERKERR